MTMDPRTRTQEDCLATEESMLERIKRIEAAAKVRGRRRRNIPKLNVSPGELAANRQQQVQQLSNVPSSSTSAVSSNATAVNTYGSITQITQEPPRFTAPGQMDVQSSTLHEQAFTETAVGQSTMHQHSLSTVNLNSELQPANSQQQLQMARAASTLALQQRPNDVLILGDGPTIEVTDDEVEEDSDDEEVDDEDLPEWIQNPAPMIGQTLGGQPAVMRNPSVRFKIDKLFYFRIPREGITIHKFREEYNRMYSQALKNADLSPFMDVINFMNCLPEMHVRQGNPTEGGDVETHRQNHPQAFAHQNVTFVRCVHQGLKWKKQHNAAVPSDLCTRIYHILSRSGRRIPLEKFRVLYTTAYGALYDHHACGFNSELQMLDSLHGAILEKTEEGETVCIGALDRNDLTVLSGESAVEATLRQALITNQLSGSEPQVVGTPEAYDRTEVNALNPSGQHSTANLTNQHSAWPVTAQQQQDYLDEQGWVHLQQELDGLSPEDLEVRRLAEEEKRDNNDYWRTHYEAAQQTGQIASSQSVFHQHNVIQETQEVDQLFAQQLDLSLQQIEECSAASQPSQAPSRPVLRQVVQQQTSQLANCTVSFKDIPLATTEDRYVRTQLCDDDWFEIPVKMVNYTSPTDFHVVHTSVCPDLRECTAALYEITDLRPDLLVVDGDFVPGLPVVCDNLRGHIDSITAEGNANITAVDTGQQLCRPRSAVYRISRRQLYYLDAQAIWCCLENWKTVQITDVNGMRDFFTSLSGEEELLMTVHATDGASLKRHVRLTLNGMDVMVLLEQRKILKRH